MIYRFLNRCSHETSADSMQQESCTCKDLYCLDIRLRSRYIVNGKCHKQ
jgi:hypothetical protein